MSLTKFKVGDYITLFDTKFLIVTVNTVTQKYTLKGLKQNLAPGVYQQPDQLVDFQMINTFAKLFELPSRGGNKLRRKNSRRRSIKKSRKNSRR
jgi:hypothetical protein